MCSTHLLESAVFGMSAGFGDTELYPSMEEKAARLASKSRSLAGMFG